VCSSDLTRFSGTSSVQAEDGLGKELLRQVQRCIVGLVPNPTQANRAQLEQVSQECYMNYVVMGTDGLPSPNVMERTLAFIKASGVKIPQRQGQGAVTLTGLTRVEEAFTLPVKLGGQTYPLLLDTGATNTVLDGSIGQRLGLKGIEVPSSLLQQGVVGTQCGKASVSVYALPVVALGKAEVQGLKGIGLSQSFLPGGLAGALGLDFLSAYDLLLDPSKNQLQLQPPTPAVKGALPLVGKNGILTTTVRINGQGPFVLGLDTGASVSIVSQRLADRLGLSPSGPVEQISGWCGAQAATPVKLNQFQMGSFGAGNLAAYVLPNSIFDLIGAEGLVGQNFLNRFRQHWRFQPLDELGLVKGGSLVLKP